MAPIRRALPLPDELIENILVRVASPRDLAFASVAHPDFRRIIAGASFPRLYRSLHPPLLLGILGPRGNGGIMPAEAPHSNAPAARALAADADFSYGHLPDGGWANWCHSDTRDGRILLMRCGLPADSVLLPELAVYDPFTRGYTLLPPIPDSLVVSSVPASEECVENFEVLFVPSGDYEETHFRVVGWTYDDAMAVVFVYSSISGTWAAGTAASWDALGFDVTLDIIGLENWLRSYTCGCFYWQVPFSHKLLKLNINRMEFSAVGLPPNYANRLVVLVEAGEGRVGIFTRTLGFPRFLQYSIRQNEGENAIEHSEETTIPLPNVYQSYYIVGTAEGYIFLRGVHVPSHGTPVSGFFTLEIKTLKVERLCSAPGRDSVRPYFGYPRFVSPRRI